MTLALYARRKQWPLEGVTVELRHSRIYAADCADCETKEGKIDRIETSIAVAGSISDEQRARLLDIAAKCPVHRTLTSEIEIRSRLADDGAPARRSGPSLRRGATPRAHPNRPDHSEEHDPDM
jgi:uncharacterized OsmC-like protein